MACKFYIIFISIALLFVSAGDLLSGQGGVRGKVFFEDMYGGRYPANGVGVRLCTRNRECGPVTITNVHGQYFLYQFPRGNVVLEVYPESPRGGFVYYNMYIGNDPYWTLPPVTIRLP